MKTYQSSGLNTNAVSILKKIVLPILIIIISFPSFSQELAIVKSSYQHITSLTSWTETIKNNEGGAANWASLSRGYAYTQKVVTEQNTDLIENSFKVCLDNRKAVINWSSYQDLKTNFYIIERSFNGQPFKEIAQVFTSPDSASKFEYQYFDKLTADTKGTIYYRLKVTDANGQPYCTTAQLASSNKTYENLLASLKN